MSTLKLFKSRYQNIVMINKNNMKEIKDFFRPTKRKVIIALLLPILFAIIIVFVSYIIQDIQIHSSESEKGVIKILLPHEENETDYYKHIINYLLEYGHYLIASLIISAIYHYPLACFLSKLIYTHKKSGINSVFSTKNIIILVVLILIFNPVSLKLIYFLFLSHTTHPHISCGLKIINITENGPIDNAGISKGETIYEIYSDNWSVFTYTPSYLGHYVVPRINPGDEISVVTDKNTYVVKVGKTKDGEPLLGLVTYLNRCACGDGICERGEEYISKKEPILVENREYFPPNFREHGCKKDCM